MKFFILLLFLTTNFLFSQEMDFSDVTIETNHIDTEKELEEEKDIEKNLKENEKKKKKNQTTIQTIKSKTEKKQETFLHFLTIIPTLKYNNFTTFENLPYENIYSLSTQIALFGLTLPNIDIYIAKMGYQLNHKTDFNSVTINPLSANFDFVYYTVPFTVDVNLFNFYVFHKLLPTKSGKGINYFFEYFGINFGYYFYKQNTHKWKIYAGFSIGPDDIDSNPKKEGFLITIGISGNYFPFKIAF